MEEMMVDKSVERTELKKVGLMVEMSAVKLAEQSAERTDETLAAKTAEKLVVKLVKFVHSKIPQVHSL